MEASLIIPVFLLALLVLSACIGTERIHEEQWDRLGWQVYQKQRQSQIAAQAMELLNETEQTSDESEAGAMDFAAAALQKNQQDRITYEIAVPVSLLRKQNNRYSSSITYHLFTGIPSSGTGCGFEALETEEEATVWVFPKRGERYHTKDCRIVTVYPKQYVLSEAIRTQYEPCTICDPENLPNGTPVYCFATGRVYHQKSCPQVERYVIPMTRDEAELKGYLPCQYCSAAP